MSAKRHWIVWAEVRRKDGAIVTHKVSIVAKNRNAALKKRK